MPYLAHFGLKEHPFSLTPNTQQYFPTATHGQILQSLEYAIRRNSGIMKVVGDVGMGKTLLCRLLLKALEGKAEVAYLNAPQAEGDALIALVCHEFGLARGDRADMLRDLNEFLLGKHAEGRDCVLVVDESQALGPEGLETIRLLSNIETERAKLLQIVLFGQTELDELLARPNLRQINQRIAFAFATGPFSAMEAASYIRHRLRTARIDGVDWDVFEPKAVDLIVRASGGVPRVINILSDKALLIAYAEGGRAVGARHVRAAVADNPSLFGAASLPASRKWTWPAVAAVAAAVGVIGGGALLGGERLAALAPIVTGLGAGVAEPAAAVDDGVPVVPPTPEPPPAEEPQAAPEKLSHAVPVEEPPPAVVRPSPEALPPPVAKPEPKVEVRAASVTVAPAPALKEATGGERSRARLTGDGRWVWN